MQDISEIERSFFDEAVALADPTEREAFLRKTCPDIDLRRRVQSLLDAHDEAGSFMRASGNVFPPQSLYQADSEELGTVIDRYKLLEKLGEGGFGSVWAAEQREPVKRLVALKVIKLGMDTRQVIARFEAEQQALALMDHPNIARVLDAGVTGSASGCPGRPYFVMELVRGIPITQYCDQEQLGTSGRLDLFVKVCHAIQHAHQKGIIHRDIKPSNILVTLHDGVPVPKVIDFGIAKAIQQELTEKTIYTQMQQFIGTPAYMSPEQAEMSGLDIDTRSDIYSLGVLLYELLTGATPFDVKELMRAGLDEMRKIIREREPLTPSSRLTKELMTCKSTGSTQNPIRNPRSAIDRDLDWIVMKCLEKDRTRRYETANSLALDVRHYLNDEPIHARPPSVGYRLQKAWRRNRIVYTAGAAIVLALICGIAASSWLALQARWARDDAFAARNAESEEATKARTAQLRADEQRRLAEANAEELIRHLYVADIKVAFQALQEDNLALARQLVYKYLPALGTRSAAVANGAVANGAVANGAVANGRGGQPPQGEKTFGPTRDLLGWEWRHLWQLCQGDASFPLGRGHHVRCVAFSPDGGMLAIGKDATVEVIDQRTQEVIELEGFDDDLNHNGLAFSHQGRYLAAKGGTVARIWEVGKWDAPIQQFESPAHKFNNTVEFSADDATFATRVPGGVRFWDTSTWQESHFEKSGATFGTVLHYSHDGEWLAISDWHKIEIRSPEYELLASPLERQFGIREWAELWVTAIDSTAKLMAAGYRDGEVIVWETKTWREVGSFRAHPSYVLGLVFAPDGQTLVTGGSDQLIKIWDVMQLRADLARAQPPTPVRMLRGHETAIFGLAYSPGKEALASTSKDGTARFWTDVKAREPSELPNSKEPLWFAPDGTRLITLDSAGRLHLWDTRARHDLGSIGPPLDGSSGRAISSDGKWLALGMTDGAIELWNLETNERAKVWKEDDRAIGQMAFSREGTLLAAANQRRPNNEQGTVRIWDMVSGRRVRKFENAFGPLAFSVDDRRLASTRLDGSAVIWNLATGLSEAEIPEDIIMSGGLAFSPVDDGLASGSELPIVHIWDASGKEVDSLMGSRMCIDNVAFAPDGRTLLARTVDNAIKLWNVPTGAELLDIGHIMEASSFLFSPNGEYLALSTISGGSGEPRLELWRAPSFDEIATAEASRADEVEAQ